MGASRGILADRKIPRSTVAAKGIADFVSGQVVVKFLLLLLLLFVATNKQTNKLINYNPTPLLYKNTKPHSQCVLDVCCSVAVDLFILLLLLLLQRSSTEIRRSSSSSSVKLLCMGGVFLCMCVCFSLGLESGGFDDSRRKGAPYKRKRFVREAFLLSFLF
jgi:hypothetical protein